MTPLKQRFIEDMLLRGLAPTTQRSYLHYVSEFAKYFNMSPEKLDLEAIRQYQMHLLSEKKMSPQSVNSFTSAVQFLYLVTLEVPWGKQCFPRVRIGSSLPVVLSPEETETFFGNVPSLKYRAVLMLCYGAGLRISEAVAVKVSDIDSKRMLIRIEEGKGGKDRYVMLSTRLREVLRSYWRAARPKDWMFPSWRENKHLSVGAVSQACMDASKQCGLTKRITTHTLRHSFATHLLENGTDTRWPQAQTKADLIPGQVRVYHCASGRQVLLGHSRIDTTARYVRVAAHVIAATTSPLDQLGSKAKQKPRK